MQVLRLQQDWTLGTKLPEQRNLAGFLISDYTVDCILLNNSQKKDYLLIDDIHLNHGTINGQQLLLKVAMEELKTKKKTEALTLLDSGCARTCIDEAWAKEQGWPLTKILKPIRVLYVDVEGGHGGTKNEEKDRSSHPIRLWMCKDMYQRSLGKRTRMAFDKNPKTYLSAIRGWIISGRINDSL
jgi:hypothetical protein